MKRLISIFLCLTFLLTACSVAETSGNTEITTDFSDYLETTTANNSDINELTFSGLNDDNLLSYIEDVVYSDTISNLNNPDYVIEEVQAVYLSKEYIEETEFNSQSNIYFGYTIDELNQQFQGNKYIFTLNDEGKTIVQELQTITNNDSNTIIKNVLIGSGVILLCSTVSFVSSAVGAPAAITVIFAVSATSAKTMALSSALFGAIISGIVEGYMTGDVTEAIEAATLGASEGFKIGAITGAITGGASEAFLLKLGTKGGLTMSEVAKIQVESNYPIELIMKFNSMEQYNIVKNAGHTSQMVNGKTALVRNIDLYYIDEITGKSNLQLMQNGKAPLDPTGIPYELHHIGQKKDSPLAILTQAEHRQNGNNTIWHILTEGFENPSKDPGWQTIKSEFWKDYARIVTGG